MLCKPAASLGVFPSPKTRLRRGSFPFRAIRYDAIPMTTTSKARRPDGTVGFLCDCGGNTTVKNSRPVPFGMVRRRRKCKACGARFSTFEVKAERYSHASGTDGLAAIKARLVQMARDITFVQDKVMAMEEVKNFIEDASNG